MSVILRGAATLLLAALAWVVLGYLATAPLGAIYGWSGHPSAPAAPIAVYVGLYLIALPLACLAGAWKATGWIGSHPPRRSR
jgi:hypothetical protein